MGLNMVERQLPGQIIARQEQLNKLVGQREALTKRLGADSIDFKTATPREVRVFGIRNRVRASIDRLNNSLTVVDSQLEAYLPQIAKDYRLELIRRERDLRSIERSGLVVPEKTLVGFKSELQELRDKPLHEPILAKALGIKMEQKAPPAPTPPVEAPAEPESFTISEIVVDKSNLQIQIGKRGQIIEDPVIKAVLELLANKGEAVHNREVAATAKAAGSTKIVPARDAIRDLRKILEEEPSNPNILVTIGHTSNSKYLLKIPVRFIEPTVRSSKPEFGAEPVAEVVLNLLNRIIDDPNLTLQQAIELRDPGASGKLLTSSRLRYSLDSAINTLIRRAKSEKLTNAERTITDKAHQLLGKENILNSLVILREKIEDWIKNGTPIIPAVEKGGPSRAGAREKRTINMPDGTTLEAIGKRGKAIQFIVSTGESFSFSVRDFSNYIYGSDNPQSISSAKKLLRDTNDHLTGLGWEVNLPADLKNIDQLMNILIRKTQKPSAPAPSAESVAEIVQLEQSLKGLIASRPAIAEAASLGLPGNYAADLQKLDELIAQKQTRLQELKQG